MEFYFLDALSLLASDWIKIIFLGLYFYKGITKVLDHKSDRDYLVKQFPFLPESIWKPLGYYQLSIPVLYMIRWKAMAMYFSLTLMGAVYWSLYLYSRYNQKNNASSFTVYLVSFFPVNFHI